MDQLRHFMDGRHFVVGYLFNNDASEVVLIEKARPKWQAGLLNGVGGEVNPNETALEAMERESTEEIDVAGAPWKRFAVLRTLQDNTRSIVHFFFAKDSAAVSWAKQMTDERIVVTPLRALGGLQTVPNVNWFIPMALTMERDRACELLITEQYPEALATTEAGALAAAARVSWQSEDGVTFRLTRPIYQVGTFATIHVGPAAKEGDGRFAWSVPVPRDCAAGANPICGRAYTLEEAKHIAETLLLCSRILPASQLPSNSPVQYTVIGTIPQGMV